MRTASPARLAELIEREREVRDRAQLVVFAYEAGLVRPGWLP